MQIQPMFLTVGSLLAGRLFRIPQYQRAYSWGSKQRSDLFMDIRKVGAGGPDGSHFMATVVALRKGKHRIVSDEFAELDVVDGQQRLTTLILLLRALAKTMDRQQKSESKVANEIDDLLVKGDDVSLLLLQTNHDSSHIFVNYLRDGTIPTSGAVKTAADANLVSAIRECEAFVKDYATGPPGGAIGLLSVVKNQLSVIFHEIEDEGLVYTVFEVLNSRGLDVTWFDKLKSLLMARVFELGGKGGKKETLDELHHIWRDVYQTHRIAPKPQQGNGAICRNALFS